MEFRSLGASGLKVPALSFGAGTFGGTGPMFSAWGNTDTAGATRLVDICIDAGATMFDTADNYSNGASETILGEAIRGRRNEVLISTKTGMPLGDGPNDAGTSRHRLLRSVESSLRRLGVDHIDLLQLHAFDASSPIEETLSALSDLVRSGKVRYVGVSNFAGWELMKSLGIAERAGWPRYVAHQVYYSLIGRDYEWELMPLARDQGVGALVWSPLGWGRLTGAIRRGQKLPETSRLNRTESYAPPVAEERLYAVVDSLVEIAAEAGKTVAQVALNWLLQRPTVSSVIIGARDEAQLVENLGATGWQLSPEQILRLDAASELTAPYPYYLYRRPGHGFIRLNPPIV